MVCVPFGGISAVSLRNCRRSAGPQKFAFEHEWPKNVEILKKKTILI
jgi:hypothetical protein